MIPQYRDSERSKVFIKITKTKVLAASVRSLTFFLLTRSFRSVNLPMPEGIVEFAHMTTPLDQVGQQQDPYGFEGDGRELRPGAQAETNTGARRTVR